MKSGSEIARAEGLHHLVVNELLRLTLLAPDIIAAILDDQLPEGVSLFDLAADVPAGWHEQRLRLKGNPPRNKGYSINRSLTAPKKYLSATVPCRSKKTEWHYSGVKAGRRIFPQLAGAILL